MSCKRYLLIATLLVPFIHAQGQAPSQTAPSDNQESVPIVLPAAQPPVEAPQKGQA